LICGLKLSRIEDWNWTDENLEVCLGFCLTETGRPAKDLHSEWKEFREISTLHDDDEKIDELGEDVLYNSRETEWRNCNW
jgi:hypothetical protein